MGIVPFEKQKRKQLGPRSTPLLYEPPYLYHFLCAKKNILSSKAQLRCQGHKYAQRQNDVGIFNTICRQKRATTVSSIVSRLFSAVFFCILYFVFCIFQFCSSCWPNEQPINNGGYRELGQYPNNLYKARRPQSTAVDRTFKPIDQNRPLQQLFTSLEF